MKSNFKIIFNQLELSYPDINALSLILNAKFVIIVVPINGEVSVLEIHHLSLDSSNLHTIFLLQSGADRTAIEYRSHYDALFPITLIDGKEPVFAGIEAKRTSAQKSKTLANRFIQFARPGDKEVVQ